MTLKHAFLGYPYLHASILSLFGALLVVRMLPTSPHRSLIIRLGFLMAVFFPFALFSEGDYWRPVRMAGGSLGFEDALCAFNMGLLGGLPAVLLFRKRLAIASRPAPRLGGLIAAGVITLSSFFALHIMGLSSMSSTIGAQLVASLALMHLRPDLLLFCLTGGTGFMLLHFGMIKVFFWIWPAFVLAWRNTPPWGVLVQGVPLGEIVWALGFGLFWSLFAGYVFDFRLAVGPSGRAEPVTEPEWKSWLQTLTAQFLRYFGKLRPEHRICGKLLR
jgi:hypothetical protein